MRTRLHVVSQALRTVTVNTAADLLAATSNPEVRVIIVHGQLTGLTTVRLGPGQVLCGEGERASLTFADGQDGVVLCHDHEIAGLALHASADRRAISNDTRVADFGRILIEDVTVTGQVQILARDAVRGGHVDVRGLHIDAADTRARAIHPEGHGVQVLQGAFTLWNQQRDDSVVITANLAGISAGRDRAPVHGSGVVVAGAGQDGGRVAAPLLETGPLYSDGGITPDRADRISAAVFAGQDVFVDVVRNRGPAVSFGAHDMVLANWGTIDRWVTTEKLTSKGVGAIGFVNFGSVNELKVTAPIETFGAGAQGFVMGAGTVHRAEFERITTHGAAITAGTAQRDIVELRIDNARAAGQ